MADGPIVGSVGVEVVPNAESWNADLRAKLLPAADKLGNDIGQAIGDRIRERLALELKNLPEATIRTNLDDAATRAELAALSRSSGSVRVTADTRTAEAAYARLRNAQQAADEAIQKSADRVTAAQNKAADASGSLRVAEQKLQEIQSQNGVSASKLAAAEERLAAAQRKSAAASTDITRAQSDLNKTRSKASTTVTDLKTRADTAAASTDLGHLQAQADKLGRSRETVKVNVDKKGLDNAEDGAGALLKTLAAFGPAIVPLAGAGVGSVLALGGSFTAAGAGAAGLAAIAIPAFKHIKDATKNASTQGSGALDELTKSEQQLYGSIHALSGVGKQFEKDLDPTVLPIFANGVNLASKNLPRFEGVVRSAAGGAEDLIVQISAATKGPVFHEFISNLQKDAGPALDSFGSALIGAGKAGAETLNYLEPLEPKVDALVTSFGQKIAAGASSNGFHGFLDTIISDAPLAGKTLGDLGKDAAGLVGAIEPLGEVSLAGLDAILEDVQPLIPEVHDLTSAIKDNAGAISPVLQGYAHLAIEVGGGLLGGLTALTNVVGDNATAFQILATAVLSVRLASKLSDIAQASKAYGILEGAVKGYAGAEASLAEADTAKGLSGAASGLGKAEKSAGGFKGAMAGATKSTGGFNVVSLATTGIIAGVAAGFIAAGKESAQFNDTLGGQFKDASKGIDLYHASGATAKLTTDGLIQSGHALLATWANMGANNPAVTQLVNYRAQVANAAGAEKELAPLLGLSANGFGDVAKQAGVSVPELEAFYQAQQIGDTKAAAKDYADIAKTINAYAQAARGASDPTYNLAAAMKDLDSKVPHDNIKDFNTALDNYSTIIAGTIGSSAAAGDALSQVRGDFDKNTKSAARNAAAQAVLSGNLLGVGPITRKFGEDLVGLNVQYGKNLEATFQAAGGANNLAVAGQKVITVAGQQKKALYQNLLQMGLSANEASKLAEKFGSIPHDLEVKIHTDGVAQAKKDITSVTSGLGKLNVGSIHFTGDTKDLQKKINDAKAIAKTLPKSQSMKLLADASAAQHALDTVEDRGKKYARDKFNASLTADNSDAINKSTKAQEVGAGWADSSFLGHFTGDDRDAVTKAGHAAEVARDFSNAHYEADLLANDKASEVARDAQNHLNAFHGSKVDIAADDHASEVARDAQNKIDQMHGNTVSVNANVYGLGEVEALRDSINGLQSRSVTVTERTIKVGGGHAAGGQVHGPGNGNRDTFLEPLANDEFVVNARQSRKYLPVLKAINAGLPIASTQRNTQLRSTTPAAVPAPQLPPQVTVVELDGKVLLTSINKADARMTRLKVRG